MRGWRFGLSASSCGRSSTHNSAGHPAAEPSTWQTHACQVLCCNALGRLGSAASLPYFSHPTGVRRIGLWFANALLLRKHKPCIIRPVAMYRWRVIARQTDIVAKESTRRRSTHAWRPPAAETFRLAQGGTPAHFPQQPLRHAPYTHTVGLLRRRWHPLCQAWYESATSSRSPGWLFGLVA